MLAIKLTLLHEETSILMATSAILAFHQLLDCDGSRVWISGKSFDVKESIDQLQVWLRWTTD